MKTQKTDKRVEYTKTAICDAFLHLKRSLSYDNITVAEICREAGIGRGTFYRHYRNTAEVLDEVLERALRDVNTLEQQLVPCGKDGAKCGYPLCKFIRENDKYKCLFFDDALTAQITDKIYKLHKDTVMQAWGEKLKLPPLSLETLAYFQISGCIGAARHSRGLTAAEWERAQGAIDDILRQGIYNK